MLFCFVCKLVLFFYIGVIFLYWSYLFVLSFYVCIGVISLYWCYFLLCELFVCIDVISLFCLFMFVLVLFVCLFLAFVSLYLLLFTEFRKSTVTNLNSKFKLKNFLSLRMKKMITKKGGLITLGIY